MAALSENQQSAASALGQIIGAIGTADFTASAARSLMTVINFEQATFFLHASGNRSQTLFSSFDGAQEQIGIEIYASQTFRLNPMLARKAGVFRARDFPRARETPVRGMRDTVIRDPREELGFRTVGWPQQLDEVGLYERACGGVLELSFYRPRSARGTPGGTVEFLRGLRVPLAAAFDRHVSLVSVREKNLTAFDEILSRREAEIAGLILLGCSSDAIARRLGIGRYTVKDHRKKIFRKLGIGSMAELFILHREKAARSAGHD